MRLELRDVHHVYASGHPLPGRGAARRLARRGAGRGARYRRRHGFGQEHARPAHESAARPDERRGTSSTAWTRRRWGRAVCGAGSGSSSSFRRPHSSPPPSRRTWPSPRRRLGLEEDEVRERVSETLRSLGVEDLAGRSPFALSGGEKRRVAIAGVLAMGPEVLVLDEPTAGLDPASREELLDLIRNLREAGVSVVLVSHDLDEVAEVADRVCALHEGRVRAVGTPAEVFYSDPAQAPATVRVASLAQRVEAGNRRARTFRRDARRFKGPAGGREMTSLGQFYPVASPVHSLDPRAKIVATAALAVGLFLIDSTTGLLFVAAALVALVAASRIPVRTFLRLLRPVLFIVALTVTFQILFSREGSVRPRVGFSRDPLRRVASRDSFWPYGYSCSSRRRGCSRRRRLPWRSPMGSKTCSPRSRGYGSRRTRWR